MDRPGCVLLLNPGDSWERQRWDNLPEVMEQSKDKVILSALDSGV